MNTPDSMELTIQRLVDNQLDAVARHSFLAAAATRPDLWRRIALAFIEDQVWHSAIPQAVRDAAPAPPSVQAAPVSGPVGQVRPEDAAGRPAANGRFSPESWQAARPEPDNRETPACLKDTVWMEPSSAGSPRERRRIRPVWLALAAGLLLVVTIAMRLAISGNGDPRTVIASGSQPMQRVTAYKPYMLQVGDDLQVPVYEEPAPMREQLARFQSSIDPELVELLRDSGFELRTELHYISGWTPDGSSVIYPVHQVHIQSAVQ